MAIHRTSSESGPDNRAAESNPSGACTGSLAPRLRVGTLERFIGGFGREDLRYLRQEGCQPMAFDSVHCRLDTRRSVVWLSKPGRRAPYLPRRTISPFLARRIFLSQFLQNR